MIGKQSRVRFWFTARNEARPAMRVKWSWGCRAFDPRQMHGLTQEDNGPPQPGDIVMARVKTLGLVNHLVTADSEQVCLYPGDGVIGVFGHPETLALYEAETAGVDDLHLVTKAGVLGSVRPAYRRLLQPTQLTFLGYLADSQGQRLNLRQRLVQLQKPVALPDPILLVVGAGVGSGKSAVVADLVDELFACGLHVAVCRLSDSRSAQGAGNLWESRAHYISDCSNYEFTPGYRAHTQDLAALFSTTLAEAARAQPDLTIIELGDTITDPENQFFFSLPLIQQCVGGLVLVAQNGAPSRQAVATLRSLADQMAVCRLRAIVTTGVDAFTRELGLISNHALICLADTHNCRPLAQAVIAHFPFS